MESGEHLGPVGGRIVGEVFVNNLLNDPTPYLNVDPDWVPSACGGSSFRMTHFLTYARVDPASRCEERPHRGRWADIPTPRAGLSPGRAAKRGTPVPGWPSTQQGPAWPRRR